MSFGLSVEDTGASDEDYVVQAAFDPCDFDDRAAVWREVAVQES
jgi:hypothetical protein